MPASGEDNGHDRPARHALRAAGTRDAFQQPSATGIGSARPGRARRSPLLLPRSDRDDAAPALDSHTQWADRPGESRGLSSAPGGFGRLYQDYGALCVAVARRVLNDDEAAQDAVHNVFLKLPQRMLTFEPQSRLTYLKAAVRNEALHLRLRRRREMPGDDRVLARADSTEPSPADVLISRERKELIDTMINRLPVRCRCVMSLLYHGQLTRAEAAARMGISVKAVEKQITRAYQLLREMPESRLLR